ncbi:MAG: hypothetical protein ABSB78_04235 [Bacteroidota bacterium]
MIEVAVFYLHAIAAIAAFTKRWQDEGFGEGILGVAFMALIFSVGWTITTFLIRLFTPEKGFSRIFDRDALSLLLLTISEGIFYYFYLKGPTKLHSPPVEEMDIKKP